MAEITVGLAVIGLGGLDQAINQGAGLGALGRACEQPVLAAKDKGPDSVFRPVVVRGDDGVLEVNQQTAPLIEGVEDRLAQQSPGRSLGGALQ